MSEKTYIPDDLMHKAVGVKTLLRFTPEAEWAVIIGEAILNERNAERMRSKKIVDEIISLVPPNP